MIKCSIVHAIAYAFYMMMNMHTPSTSVVYGFSVSYNEDTKLLTASDAAESDYFGFAVSILTSGSGSDINSINTATAIMGAPYNSHSGLYEPGAAYIFESNSTILTTDGSLASVWSQTDKLTASDAANHQNFGVSVFMSRTNNMAIVGADGGAGNLNTVGGAYIFEKYSGTDGLKWYQTSKLVGSDTVVKDYFGWSVAISDYSDTNNINNDIVAIVGSYGDSDDGSSSGSAYVFEYAQSSSDGNWEQTQKLTASDAGEGDRFGYSLSMAKSNMITIGAYGGDKAYIFEKNDQWYESAILRSDLVSGAAQFGRSVAINLNDIAVIGANYDNANGISQSGSVFIYKKDSSDGMWYQLQQLIPSDAQEQGFFGTSVSISDDNIILVGTQWDEKIYVFGKDRVSSADTWEEVAIINASDGDSDDIFGYAVSISPDGNMAVVGAHGDASYTGSAYIYSIAANQTTTMVPTGVPTQLPVIVPTAMPVEDVSGDDGDDGSMAVMVGVNSNGWCCLCCIFSLQLFAVVFGTGVF